MVGISPSVQTVHIVFYKVQFKKYGMIYKVVQI